MKDFDPKGDGPGIFSGWKARAAAVLGAAAAAVALSECEFNEGDRTREGVPSLRDNTLPIHPSSVDDETRSLRGVHPDFVQFTETVAAIQKLSEQQLSKARALLSGGAASLNPDNQEIPSVEQIASVQRALLGDLVRLGKVQKADVDSVLALNFEDPRYRPQLEALTMRNGLLPYFHLLATPEGPYLVASIHKVEFDNDLNATLRARADELGGLASVKFTTGKIVESVMNTDLHYDTLGMALPQEESAPSYAILFGLKAIAEQSEQLGISAEGQLRLAMLNELGNIAFDRASKDPECKSRIEKFCAEYNWLSTHIAEAYSDYIELKFAPADLREAVLTQRLLTESESYRFSRLMHEQFIREFGAKGLDLGNGKEPLYSHILAGFERFWREMGVPGAK